MNTKLLLLVCLVGLAASKIEKTRDVYTGHRIFQGILNTFVNLMTPHDSDLKSNLSRRSLVDLTASKVQEAKNGFIAEWKNGLKYDPDLNDFFDVFPRFAGTLALGSPLQVIGPCFQDMNAVANKNDDGTVTVQIHLSDPESFFCRVALIVSVDADTRVTEYFTQGDKEITFNAPEGEANTWDLYERGPRIFVYDMPLETAVANLGKTVALFEPCLTRGVLPYFAELNLEFLKNYAGIEMAERNNPPEILQIDTNLVQNGDTFNIMRLDGLDPMIAWAMGAATGHVAIALWRENELFLCESNALSPYWPVNGIQCNTYADWMEYGRLNDYNVVWTPLSRDLVKNFNDAAAWEFVDEHMGIDYGWEVVLMGWLDSHEGNKVCADTAGTRCTEKEHFEMIFSVGDTISKDISRILKPAVNQRAGVPLDSPIVEAYFKAETELGIVAGDVHIIPELDSNIYLTTRYGEPEESDVSICNVFTCKVLRAAGVFGDQGEDFNCGEFSVNDNYRMKIYEENFERPQVCIDVDPENPLCQVLGKYSLRLDSQPGTLPRYNYVDIHDGFGDNCPSLAPFYEAPLDC